MGRGFKSLLRYAFLRLTSQRAIDLAFRPPYDQFALGEEPEAKN